MQNMKINQIPIEMPDITEKVQEMDDFENELYQSTRDIKKLNKKKRKKALTNTDLQPKKMKLSKIDSDIKLKKKKLVNSWVETDSTPEEISINGSNSYHETIIGSSSDNRTENVINSTTGKKMFPPSNDEFNFVIFRTVYCYRCMGNSATGGRGGIFHFEKRYKTANQRGQR